VGPLGVLFVDRWARQRPRKILLGQAVKGFLARLKMFAGQGPQATVWPQMAIAMAKVLCEQFRSNAAASQTQIRADGSRWSA